jgi:hypothetical protein
MTETHGVSEPRASEPRASEPRGATPDRLRDGVRDALLTALRDDADRSGAPAARRLAAAGAAGTLGAIGALLLLSGHPFGHHPAWHHLTFACLWAALLVVVFALYWLRVRTPRWPLGDASRTALIALGLAGFAAPLSPDPHMLHAWSAWWAGAWLDRALGPFVSAFALGMASSLPLAALAYWLSVPRVRRPERRLALAAAAMIAALLAPGIALQCVGEPWRAALGWLLGALGGAGAGVGFVRVVSPPPSRPGAAAHARRP